MGRKAALRALKRRISDALHQGMIEDARDTTPAAARTRFDFTEVLMSCGPSLCAPLGALDSGCAFG